MLAALQQSALRLGAVLALGAACGCSLNPQPLPPGEGPDAGGGSQVIADATTGNDATGGFGSGDAGARQDATADALPSVPGTDAGDAESDAPADRASEGGFDGPYDGPTDGGSEDGE